MPQPPLSPTPRSSRRSVLGLLGVVPVAAGGVLATAETARGGVPGNSAPVGSLPKDLLAGGAYDRFVAQQAAANQFSGTLLLAHRGQPVLARSFGMANKELSIPNRTDTVFNTASVGKAFTAVAVAQLAQQGKVAFDQTVGRYLSGFPTAVANTVTVHQMLTHTSGLPEYQFSPAWQQGVSRWRTPAESFDGTMDIIRGMAPQFTPGTSYSYSNSGFYTLGAIVAQVSGQTFWDYARQHVLAPAGMTRSGFYTTSQWQTDREFAHAYGPAQPDGQRDDVTMQIEGIGIGGGAGGAFSTAPDMVRFIRALWDGTLLPPAFTELVTSPKYPIPPDSRNPSQGDDLLLAAYGLDEYIVNNQRILRRTGTTQAMSAGISVYPDLGWTAVILGNYAIDIVKYHQLQDSIITRQ